MTQRNHLPPIDDLRASNSKLLQTDVLDLLFEPSHAIHRILLPVVQNTDYKSYSELIDACHAELLSLAASVTADGPDRNHILLSVLASHPRLGDKRIESAQSAAEQAALGGADEELARLNREYEDRFPGLRYVVFVKGRGRPEIKQDMKSRIGRNDYTKEVHAALQAMCDIAKDRASKLAEQSPKADKGGRSVT